MIETEKLFMFSFLGAWEELLPNTMAEVPGQDKLLRRTRWTPVPVLPA